MTSIFLPPFSFKSSGELRDLHSFPTRRSSDLNIDYTVDHCRGGTHTSTCLGSPFLLTSGSIQGVESMMLPLVRDRKSTRLNSSHTVISYAVFCLKKKDE